MAAADNAELEPWTRRTLLIGECGPLRVTAGATIAAGIELRPRRPTDLPILLALPELGPTRENLVSGQAPFASAADAVPVATGT